MYITSDSNKNHISMYDSVRYQLPFLSYLTRCSWENLHFAATSRNISVISCGVSLVTIPLLDLLIFH